MKVIFRLVARPDTVAALKSVLLEVARQSRKEADCISYNVLQNQADPCDFTLVEDWKSAAAVDAHLTKPHVQEAFAKGVPLLAGEPDSRRYETVG